VNSNLYKDVNSWSRDSGWLHPFMKAYAGYGIVLFGLLLLVGLIVAWRRRDMVAAAAAVWGGVAALIAVAITQPIASAAAEPRPFVRIPGALVLVHRASDFSFPSDHAVAAGAIAAALLFCDLTLGIVAWIAALLMAFARVYVGVHYPGDVLAGLALGAAVAVVGWLVLRPLFIAGSEALARRAERLRA
jgi:undecaprenyl-diphosphatase